MLIDFPDTSTFPNSMSSTFQQRHAEVMQAMMQDAELQTKVRETLAHANTVDDGGPKLQREVDKLLQEEKHRRKRQRTREFEEL